MWRPTAAMAWLACLLHSAQAQSSLPLGPEGISGASASPVQHGCVVFAAVGDPRFVAAPSSGGSGKCEGEVAAKRRPVLGTRLPCSISPPSGSAPTS